MKKNLMILMLISPVMVLAQKGNYILKGKIGALNSPAKIYLGYKTSRGSFEDSAEIKNGQFEFKGSIAEPIQSTLVLSYLGDGVWTKTSESMSVYLEQGTVAVNSPDSLSHASVTGSNTNTEYKKLRAALKESDAKMEVVMASLKDLPADKKKDKPFLNEFMKGYIQQTREIIAVQNQIRTDFIKKNPNSFVSLDALKTFERLSPDITALDPLFNSLSTTVKSSGEGQVFAYRLNKMKVMEVGAMALPFTLNDPDGKPISLSSFKGKYVFVDFWASWCFACRQENPNVVKAYNAYHDKGLEMLSVSFDKENGREAWLKAIKKDGIIWTNVSDLKGWKSEVARLYGINAIPQNMLLDKTGKIIAKNIKGEALQAKLAEIFK